MKKGIRHIWWLCCGIMMMTLTACYSYENDREQKQEPTMLTVYVYSPEHPILTRADVGRIEASTAERAIKSLKIWVFNVNTGEKVCDYTLADNEITMLNSSENGRYQIPVSDDFAQKKPDVDVFVAANVPDIYNIGTREELLNATVTGFGLSDMTTTVPDAGLPMSGMLRSQPVVGDAPVLRIGTERELAVVPLVRAVSKLRFVFATTTNAATLKITGITLQSDKIPTTEYLFRQDKPMTYPDAGVATLFNGNEQAADNPDPTAYIYAGQAAQEYETLINDGISQSKLTEIGPYYLRESDRKLEGQIKYILGNGAEQTSSFSMERAGDFLRNHSWIVYAYHTGGLFLELNTVYVKTWTTKEMNHNVFNW